jgi:hypothetical protein
MRGLFSLPLDETGEEIWINDTLGNRDSNRSRLAPQGYLPSPTRTTSMCHP